MKPLVLPLPPQWGLYVTKACIDPAFAAAESRICTNTSDPRARSCSFGAGLTCRTCPDNAMCPGGNRAWPRPGFYVTAESSGDLVQCAAPASTRCLGWDTVIGASACGSGCQGGACTWCWPRFYLAIDLTCVSCPPTNGVWDMARPWGILLGAVAAITTDALAFVFVIANASSGTLSASGDRLLNMDSWTVSTVQMIAVVSQAPTPGLTPRPSGTVHPL